VPLLSGESSADVQACARYLAQGQLVAFATETVYGLGADACNDDAVASIYAAKGRPVGHPLIVHVASVDAALAFCPTLGSSAQRLVAECWPGPLTVIVPRRPGVARAAAGGQDTVGLRMPAHPVALALLREAAAMGVMGVAAPSANRFGRVSPTTAAHVVQEFGPSLWVLDGGACEVGIESTIVDCTREPPSLLRPGQIGRAALERLLGSSLGSRDAASPRAPGTLSAHYAPAAPVRLVQAADLAAVLAALPPGGQGAAVYSRESHAGVAGVKAWRHLPDTAAAAAHDLFGVLREFDDQGVDCILVEMLPAEPEWEGVLDRLQRAASA